MLQDYIRQLNEAIKNTDKVEFDKVLKELGKLGMDKQSAMVVLKDLLERGEL